MFPYYSAADEDRLPAALDAAVGQFELRRSYPVANKHHTCAASAVCRGIEPGERYTRVVYLVEGKIIRHTAPPVPQ